ncbi:MAG: hypothetical protein J5802_03325 [Butyrivibrio sp.]|nr:hypothetical protein [Butyrivibrio sp.]
MAKSYENIVSDISNYISKCGGKYSEYYCGITNDAERRIFDEHNVDKNGVWIYRTATSDAVAREAEKFFLNSGCKGGTGGGSDDCKIVYCYKITSTTEQ